MRLDSGLACLHSRLVRLYSGFDSGLEDKDLRLQSRIYCLASRLNPILAGLDFRLDSRLEDKDLRLKTMTWSHLCDAVYDCKDQCQGYVGV